MAAVDMMDDEQSFETILLSFRLSQKATNCPTGDFPTASDLLMASNVEQIKSLVMNQNKMYRSHTTAVLHQRISVEPCPSLLSLDYICD